MKSKKKVSISEAREKLPSLVREAERGLVVTLTRRGEAVAVLVSTERYDAHAKGTIPLGRALEDFRNTHDLKVLDIESAYENVRDTSEGRGVPL